METLALEKPAKIEVLAANIPAEIKALHRWVTWDWSWSTKSNKWTKPPLQANKLLASSTDPKTWTKFEVAAMLGRNRAGVGFILGADVGIVGIDLDKCRDPATGEIKPLQAEIIRELATYAEVSPSGTGVKLLCRGVLPEKCRKANHELGIEIYCDKRYFTITGHVLPGTPATINSSQSQIDRLISRFMGTSQADLPQPDYASPEDEIELAKSALQAVPASLADGYTDWLMVGMALHAISPYLLDDWDRWSTASAKYAPGECAAKWSTFDGQGVGPGTLYHFAKMQGWTPPRGWRKAKPAIDISTMPNIANYVWDIEVAKDGSERKTKVAIPQKQLVDGILKRFGGWPKGIGKQLFICRDGQIEMLSKSANLFSWMREEADVTWGFGDSMVTKDELFISLSRHVEKFDDIQNCPHFPRVDGVFYTCPDIQPGSGKHLEQLLNFFSPSSPVDRQLMLAAIVTTLWGGLSGQRPSFLFEAEARAGQGSGKSTAAQLLSRLTGGYVDLPTKKIDITEIKKAFMNVGAEVYRVALLDNVKTSNFSDAGIESLMTAPTINGHRMWVGNTSCPNFYTWFITMNGPKLSRDFAQRCVTIMLSRPVHTGNWMVDVVNFMERHRQDIFADVAKFFQRPRQELSRHSRWGTWEQDIVSRLDDPNKIIKVIHQREIDNDVDAATAIDIEDYIADQLDRYGYSETHLVHIPNKLVNQWTCNAIEENEGMKKTTNLLDRLDNCGSFARLRRNPSHKNGRGWLFGSSDTYESVSYDLDDRMKMRNGTA